MVAAEVQLLQPPLLRLPLCLVQFFISRPVEKLVVVDLQAARPQREEGDVGGDDHGAVQNDAHEKKAAADIKWGSFSTSFFDALPIVNVAFTAHYNGLRFYQELQDRSIAKFARTIAISSSICLLVYGAAALSGYLVFGSATEGDVLENFQGAWPAAIAAHARYMRNEWNDNVCRLVSVTNDLSREFRVSATFWEVKGAPCAPKRGVAALSSGSIG